MKRRILATLLSLCLLVGMLPTAALATDEGTADEPQSVGCAELSGCIDGVHDPNCPLYEEPAANNNITSEPLTAKSEVDSGASLLGEVSEDGMSGNCGANDSDSVTWKLEQNNGDSENPTYTLTFTGTGDITWEWRTAAENNGEKVPPYYSNYATKITKVVFGEGITGGARAACAGFTSLTEVTLPSTFSQMGNDMFSGCTSLTSIDFPASLTFIGNNSFRNCTSLTTVNFAQDTGEITITGFYGCTALESITLPDKVTSIGNNAFQNSGLTSITIDPSVSCKIGQSAFANCTSLESATIGESVTTVGQQAFYGDTALTTVSVAANEIGQQAFGQCTSLANVELKEGVTTIGDNAFATTKDNDHGKLTVIRLPSTVTSIGTAFNQAYELKTLDMSAATNITFPNSGLALNMTAIVYVSTAEIANSLRDKDSKDTVTIAVTNGGTFAEGTVFESGKLATPTKDGAIFDGWYANADFTGEKVTSASNGETYYAKWIDLSTLSVDSIQYGGTADTPTLDGVTFSNWQSADSAIASIEDGQIKANKVGQTTLTADATTSTGGSAKATVSVEVTPRVLSFTYTDTGSGSITYNYSGGHHALSDSLTFQWKDNPNTAVELVEGTDINYTYTVTDSEGQGGGTTQTYDYLPMPVGTYDNVKFNLLNENYTFGLSDGSTRDYLEIDVNVVAEGSQRAYLASAWPKADQNFVYTGEGVLPVEGTLSAYSEDSTSSATVDIGTFTVNIEGLNDTSFHSEVSGIDAGTDLSAISGLALPTEPGTYIITASAASETHYLYKSLVFTISKATVTVKADDKSVYVGDTMPELTYTVSGLASGDSLTAEPTLTCNATDTNTAGTYTIIPSGGEVDTTHYTLAYESGTLTVSTRSSGGGGSSSSNVSGSGDNVSITASGGSVTASQMESAVNKADEGATITIKATSSTTVSLPVGGMADAADNDNDVLLDLRYGEITLSARAIAGMTDGVSSSGKIKVSIASQTSSKDETISDLLDKGAAVFDVSVTVNDVEVHSFDSTLTITLSVSNLSKVTDPHILHILTDGTKEYYAPDSISGNTITVKGIHNLSTFAVIPGSEVPEEQINPFTDVYESDYYYDAVLWAVENGVTNGTSATTFGPNVTVTRAQMVTFLWRAYGSPEATGANPFTDVSTSDYYYYDAVLWAVENGVTNGTSATTFSPDMAVTRAQAVTFQWRAAGSPVVSGSSFSDVAAGAYYVNAVTWAVANGITNGTSGTTFSPDAAVSRAQAVTFLWRELA